MARRRQRTWWRVAGLLLVSLYVALHAIWMMLLVALRFVDPPTTGVQMQRRVEALVSWRAYAKRYNPVPLRRISPDLQHAVIAAEDGRFYQHHGIDWAQVEKVAANARETGQLGRGASTITQQLVKNLFFTTHRNPVRKGFEYTLAPIADVVLGKQRVLELYLNVVEWGSGIYGAEAAAAYYYNSTAMKLDRGQSARLAACLPAPRKRRPARMNQYSAEILQRMRQMGW